MGVTRLPLCDFPMFPAHERRTVQPAHRTVAVLVATMSLQPVSVIREIANNLNHQDTKTPRGMIGET